MKKLLLLLTLIGGGAATARAQNSIAAGTVALGGSIGYDRSSTETGLGGSTANVSESQFNFAPAASYFVADNLAIGLDLNLREQRPGNNRGLSVGPFVQYYKMFSEQFGLTGAFGAGYTLFDQSAVLGNQFFKFKSSGFYAGITPGIVFFPIPKFALNATIGRLGYSRVSVNDDDAPAGYESSRSDFGARFGLNQLQLGGTFYFGR